MGKTSIEWTDMSINPIRARDKETGAVGHYCQKVSSGCAHCYASRLQRRFRMPEFGGVKPELPENIELFLDESKLEEVLRRKKPTKFFWADMTDLFGWWVDDLMIDVCFDAMARSPQHVHQVLTKRPERAAKMLKRLPDNIWIGTSVENQEQANKRIPELLKIPAAVRFLSCEPLLGNLDLSRWLFAWDPITFKHTPGGYCDKQYYPKIDWVIAGGESGPGSRPMHPDWVRSIRDQCTVAGVPFFFKQWGKKAAGRMLDGREWSEFPILGVTRHENVQN